MSLPRSRGEWRAPMGFQVRGMGEHAWVELPHIGLCIITKCVVVDVGWIGVWCQYEQRGGWGQAWVSNRCRKRAWVSNAWGWLVQPLLALLGP